MNAKYSSLSKGQWDNLEALANNAHDAISKLSFELLLAASKLDADKELQERFMAEAKRVSDADQSFLPSYFFHCQPEWTGGDSTDPMNFTLREPHIAKRRLTVENK